VRAAAATMDSPIPRPRPIDARSEFRESSYKAGISYAGTTAPDVRLTPWWGSPPAPSPGSFGAKGYRAGWFRALPYTKITAWTRSRRSSFMRIRSAWVRIVDSSTTSAAAISRLDSPRATCRRTSPAGGHRGEFGRVSELRRGLTGNAGDHPTGDRRGSVRSPRRRGVRRDTARYHGGDLALYRAKTGGGDRVAAA
jgi:hypothetical protein